MADVYYDHYMTNPTEGEPQADLDRIGQMLIDAGCRHVRGGISGSAQRRGNEHRLQQPYFKAGGVVVTVNMPFDQSVSTAQQRRFERQMIRRRWHEWGGSWFSRQEFSTLEYARFAAHRDRVRELACEPGRGVTFARLQLSPRLWAWRIKYGSRYAAALAVGVLIGLVI